MSSVGVQWLSNDWHPTLTRVASTSSPDDWEAMPSGTTSVTPTAAITALESVSPWGLMGRFSLRPDGSVASRCNVNTTSLQSGRSACYSDAADQWAIDNAEPIVEQKMTYIPQFCFVCDTTTTTYDNTVRFWVGQVGDTIPTYDPDDGTLDDIEGRELITSDIHQAFFIDGVAYPHSWLSSFEAYDEFPVTGVHKLNSVANVRPTNGLNADGSSNDVFTPTNMRTYADEINTMFGVDGWRIPTVQMMSTLKPLYMVEYGTVNSDVLGYGVCDQSVQSNTGFTAGYSGGIDSGNASYGVGIASSSTPVSFHSVENPFGNLSTVVDGINVYDYAVTLAYQTFDKTKYSFTQNGNVTPYSITGLSTPATPSEDWIDCISEVHSTSNLWAFIPKTIEALNIDGGVGVQSFFCDAHIGEPGQRVPAFGGDYTLQTGFPGLFAWRYPDNIYTYDWAGTRLQYMDVRTS